MDHRILQPMSCPAPVYARLMQSSVVHENNAEVFFLTGQISQESYLCVLRWLAPYRLQQRRDHGKLHHNAEWPAKLPKVPNNRQHRQIRRPRGRILPHGVSSLWRGVMTTGIDERHSVPSAKGLIITFARKSSAINNVEQQHIGIYTRRRDAINIKLSLSLTNFTTKNSKRYVDCTKFSMKRIMGVSEHR